jgi:hypothetical protein
MSKEQTKLFDKRLSNVSKMQKYVDENVVAWQLCSVCCGRGVPPETKHKIRECLQDKTTKIIILRIETRYVCPVCLCPEDSMVEMIAHLGFHNWRDLVLFGISKVKCLKVFLP